MSTLKNTTINGTLNVTNNTTFNGTVHVTNNTPLLGTLEADRKTFAVIMEPVNSTISTPINTVDSDESRLTIPVTLSVIEPVNPVIPVMPVIPVNPPNPPLNPPNKPPVKPAASTEPANWVYECPDESSWTFPLTPFVGYGWMPSTEVSVTSAAGTIPNIKAGGAKGAFAGTALSAIKKNVVTGLIYGVELAGGAGISLKNKLTTAESNNPAAAPISVTMEQNVKGWYSLNALLGKSLTPNLSLIGKLGAMRAHIADEAQILETGTAFAFSTNTENRTGFHAAGELEYTAENSQFLLSYETMNYGHVDLHLKSGFAPTWAAKSTPISDRIDAVRLGYRYAF